MEHSLKSVIATELIEAIPDAVVITDPCSVIVSNNSAARFLLRSDHDLIGRSLHDFVRYHTDIGLSGEHTVSAPGTLIPLFGDSFPVQSLSTPIQDAELWVTVIKKLTGSGSRAEHDATYVLELLSEGVLLVGDGGSVLYLNRATRDMLGIEDELFPETNVRELLNQRKEDRPEYRDQEHFLDRVLIGGSPIVGEHAFLRNGDCDRPEHYSSRAC
jgi:PAS domain-containing protein